MSGSGPGQRATVGIERTTSAPRSFREDLLCELFGETLEQGKLGADDDFFELGGHSLLGTKLAVRISSVFGVKVGLRALIESPTPRAFATRFATPFALDNPESGYDAVLSLRSNGSEAPLFCLHPGGGLGWAFIGLAKHLGPGIPIYAVQARGLARPTEPLPTSVSEMAADYADGIQEVWRSGPYRLLGWSFGGIAAHAVAVELQRRGAEVSHLVVLDVHPGWQQWTHGDVPDNDEEGLRAQMPFLIGPTEAAALLKSCETVEVDEVLEVLRDQGSALGSLDADRLRAILMISSNNSHLMIDYRPEVFDGGILLVATTDQTDPQVTARAWRPYLSGELDLHVIEGEHATMMTAPASLDAIGRLVGFVLRGATAVL